MDLQTTHPPRRLEAKKLEARGRWEHHPAMNFPQYWAKGTYGGFSCWRWSNNSHEEAATLAGVAAEQLAVRYKAGDLNRNRYGYASGRPLREPVLREFKGESGDTAAVITRNSYGCLVLNTARMMFVDVDLPERERPPGLGTWFKGLFGGGRTAAPNPTPDPAQTELLAKAEKVVQRHPEWGWRIYRTRAGFRLLATHRLFEPGTVDSEPVFDELGADPLYRQLCKSQKCFRARLTPKAWRCKLGLPPAWPWLDARAEEHFKKWETRYLAACRERATCDLIATLGNSQVDAAIQPLLAVHDETTRAASKLPLA
jgi:hypothetical protein